MTRRILKTRIARGSTYAYLQGTFICLSNNLFPIFFTGQGILYFISCRACLVKIVIYMCVYPSRINL